ncbi:T9SS type A sorting domain-containing protein [Chitinispirillales bacterium ANBcel5]|uniref:T9SS type A sorting domain-containing protein n=1 Tax=Cellulosispirillum alkaliphilum TaxID=3039283 RepID=UPI002A4F5F57|nr:T9SS type A sorting domain-containing protein [Chitinispirillales bacterium ANBcel5]
MGKSIMKASLWSIRSVFSIYSKFIALVFALFCVASGQVQNNSGTESQNEKPKIRGRALRATDSTVIANTKIILSSTAAPLYGVSNYYPRDEDYSSNFFHLPIDSTKSDENGYFELTLDYFDRLSQMEFVAKLDESEGKVLYATDNTFISPIDPDSVYTFYLSPKGRVPVTRQIENRGKRQLQVSRGRTISITITDWNGAKTSDISVIDLKGNTVARLQASETGVISWDTQNTPGGVYLLRLNNSLRDIYTRIVVK